MEENWQGSTIATSISQMRELQEMSLCACHKGGQRAPQLQEIRLEREEEGKKPTYHDFSVQRFFKLKYSEKKDFKSDTVGWHLPGEPPTATALVNTVPGPTRRNNKHICRLHTRLTRHFHVKEWSWIFKTYTKVNSKWIRALNTEVKIIEF